MPRRAEQELDAALEVRLPLGLRCLLWFSSCGGIRLIPMPVQGKFGFPEVGMRK